jgi:hypothetical protein
MFNRGKTQKADTASKAWKQDEMKVNNYYFKKREDSRELAFPSSDKNYVLCGKVYREGLKVYEEHWDGTAILISPKVKRIRKNVVTTDYGYDYTLGNVNPTYDEIIQSYKSGIPVLHDWSLKLNEKGEVRRYILSGKVLDLEERARKNPLAEKRTSGEVVRQTGNFVTFLDGTKYLVIWCEPNEDAWREAMYTGEMAGIQTRDFERYIEGLYRPHLKLKDYYYYEKLRNQ